MCVMEDMGVREVMNVKRDNIISLMGRDTNCWEKFFVSGCLQQCMHDCVCVCVC